MSDAAKNSSSDSNETSQEAREAGSEQYGVEREIFPGVYFTDFRSGPRSDEMEQNQPGNEDKEESSVPNLEVSVLFIRFASCVFFPPIP